MIISNDKEKKILLEAGRRLRYVLDSVCEKIVPGITTKQLDNYAYKIIKDFGDTPSFLNYKPAGAKIAFPASLCVSVNSAIVHGIPTKEEIIKNGDIVSIDCGLIHNKIFVDSAQTIIVGDGDKNAKLLVEATRKAINHSLVFARAGLKTGDVGNAIETIAIENNFTIPPEFGGHGVGKAVHEEPFIPNIGDAGSGEKFVEGQVVAIEPIFIEGENPTVKLADDNFTYLTNDGTRAAHFEHTIIINKEAPTIVTGKMW